MIRIDFKKNIVGVVLLFATMLNLATASLHAQESTGESAENASTQDEELKVGDTAPDFEVTTFGEKIVRLSERTGDEGHPVILVFSRANS